MGKVILGMKLETLSPLTIQCCQGDGFGSIEGQKVLPADSLLLPRLACPFGKVSLFFILSMAAVFSERGRADDRT